MIPLSDIDICRVHIAVQRLFEKHSQYTHHHQKRQRIRREREREREQERKRDRESTNRMNVVCFE